VNRLSIKFLLSAAGLALLLAAPADAAERKYRSQVKSKPAAGAAYRAVRSYDSNTVTFSDYVLGTDPDPRIRQQMRQDLGARFGAGPN
jgi:hypothetical protein